jgi:hypothetical protein
MSGLRRYSERSDATVPADGACRRIASIQALADLGQRQADTGQFEAAIAAYQEALKVWRGADASMAQDNIAMKNLKEQITYTVEKTAKGAQVRIATRSPQALIAVHEFLRFQIKDHRTGDSLAVQANPSA